MTTMSFYSSDSSTEKSDKNLSKYLLKADIEKESNTDKQSNKVKQDSEIGHLHRSSKNIQRTWFKGSRDRGLRGNIAA